MTRPAGSFVETRRTWSSSIGSRLLLRSSRRTCHQENLWLTTFPMFHHPVLLPHRFPQYFLFLQFPSTQLLRHPPEP
ncbi:unnamed protein product [Dibothriocephalus latus]|uniref:Uncharacterized protein n=1 Tax=Dibothriocephalus latus TaxID=60516 RepID=A0A3P6Q318_DIBLA|nr:unnamed protein product [Dibothriocephalus latus]